MSEWSSVVGPLLVSQSTAWWETHIFGVATVSIMRYLYEHEGETQEGGDSGVFFSFFQHTILLSIAQRPGPFYHGILRAWHGTQALKRYLPS